MSVAGDGLTEPFIYSRNARMQTNLLKSTNKKYRLRAVLFVGTVFTRRRFEQENAVFAIRLPIFFIEKLSYLWYLAIRI